MIPAQMLRALCLGLSVFLLLGAGEALANPRYAALVMDADTGRILYESNGNAQRHPASLTKMMTLYMAFRALESGALSAQQKIPVSKHAAAQSPSKLGLRPGQTISVEQAMQSLVTQSANDAAVVLAEAISGSESAFGRDMTAIAQQLGMTRTRFKNASGLPNPEQVTCARDMARLALALLNHYPQHYTRFAQRSFTFKGVTHINHNRLMQRYDGMDGIKTGFIRASGFNLVASAVRGGRRVVGVVFGGKSARSRDDHMASLLNDAFSRLGVGGAVVAQKKKSGKNETLTVASRSIGLAPAPPRRKPGSGAPPPPAAPARASALPEDLRALRAPATHALPPAAPPPAGRVMAAGPVGWSIQIGAFATRSAAETALAQAAAAAPGLLPPPKGRLVEVHFGSQIIYRAQYAGLEQAQAQASCAQLAARGRECTMLQPGM